MKSNNNVWTINPQIIKYDITKKFADDIEYYKDTLFDAEIRIAFEVRIADYLDALKIVEDFEELIESMYSTNTVVEEEGENECEVLEEK